MGSALNVCGSVTLPNTEPTYGTVHLNIWVGWEKLKIITSLATVHERIRVFPQVMKAAAETSQVLLTNCWRNSGRREQDSP